MKNPTFVGTKINGRIDGEVTGVTAEWLLELLINSEKARLECYLCSLIAAKIHDGFEGETFELDTSAPKPYEEVDDEHFFFYASQCSPKIVYGLLSQVFSPQFMETVRFRMEDDFFVVFDETGPTVGHYSFSITEMMELCMDGDGECVPEVQKLFGDSVEKTEFDEWQIRLGQAEIRRLILEKIDPEFTLPPISFVIDTFAGDY